MDNPMLGIVAILGLVAANGLFVAAEFAAVAARRTRLVPLVEQGSRTARLVLRVVENPNNFLAATQLGITMASLGLGWIGEPALARLFDPLAARLPPTVREVGAHALAAAAAFAVITVLHIVFGELAAKSVALWRPEGTAMVVVPPTNLFLRAFWPAIRLLNGLANGALGLFGLKAPSGHHVYSSEEIRMLVTESQRHGAVEPDEAQLVHRAFRFGERTAVEVMVPRVAVRGVPLGSTVRDAVAAVREAGYTRLPVYEESLDAIRGMVHTKDLMLALADGRDDEPIERSLRPVLAVPGTKLVVDLLDEMRDQRRPLAVILDEYGGTAGIVTLEDLLEEIVGEIPGEFRQERRLVHLRQPNRIVVDAAIPLEELNEMLGTALPTEHANTLGGFLFHRLGAVPERGRSVEEAGLVFTVLSASRTRIETVEIRRASG